MSAAERHFFSEAHWDGHSARWVVWAWEEPYRGGITDSDVPGSRKRQGAGWTSKHRVGTRRTAAGARRLGRRALRRARLNAAARADRRPPPPPIPISEGQRR